MSRQDATDADPPSEAEPTRLSPSARDRIQETASQTRQKAVETAISRLEARTTLEQAERAEIRDLAHRLTTEILAGPLDALDGPTETDRSAPVPGTRASEADVERSAERSDGRVLRLFGVATEDQGNESD